MSASNKEVANIFNVEPKSIHMARYRIKQKLQLDKEMDLETFIKSVA
jgi:DNA-binding CsgD family transcriptional regulator